MPFEPGHNKSNGRPKGTPNKTTKEAREVIMAAINNQSEHFEEVMCKLKQTEPKEWARIMTKLFDFVLPKKADITTNGNDISASIDLSKLSDKTLDELRRAVGNGK